MIGPLINNKTYVEVTNLDHGGKGWELGRCLWSPVFNKGKTRSWQIMTKVQENDLIFHFVRYKGTYHWYGISQVECTYILTDTSPSKPTKWGDMPPYYRIPLKGYKSLETPYNSKELFLQYKDQLERIKRETKKGLFYNLYGGVQLRMTEGYLFEMPKELIELFNLISDNIGFDYQPSQNKLIEKPTDNEPPQIDWSSPQREDTVVSRIIRDTKLVRKIKKDSDYSCQICGLQIRLPNGNHYAEGHHLQPLGGVHKGPDIQNNIIILCPNHHTEFDYGSIAIHPTSGQVVHADKENSFHGKSLTYTREDLGIDFIKYHYAHIFS